MNIDRDELDAYWQEARALDFTSAQRDAADAVSTWTWSDGPTQWLLPLGRELAGEVGRSLDEPPQVEREGLVGYGFDEQGRLRLIREIVDPGGKRPLGDWVTIINYQPDLIRWVEYGVAPGRGVRSVGRYALQDGAPVDCLQLQKSSYALQRYSRDEHGRVVRIDEEDIVSWRAKRRSRRVEKTAVYRIAHDASGLLAIDVERGAYKHAIFRRPVAGAVDDLAKELEALLVADIPTRVAQLKLTERAYDLALVWNEAADVLPPAIALGVESERKRLMRDGLETAPAEKARFTAGPLDFHRNGGRILDLCLTLQPLLPENTQVELLSRVAATLAKHDWATHLPVTEDFSVYVCDMWGSVEG